MTFSTTASNRIQSCGIQIGMFDICPISQCVTSYDEYVLCGVPSSTSRIKSNCGACSFLPRSELNSLPIRLDATMLCAEKAIAALAHFCHDQI